MEGKEVIPEDWRILFVHPKWTAKKADHQSFHVNWFETFTPALGLRFIKANYRGVEILEYPTIREYEKQQQLQYLGIIN